MNWERERGSVRICGLFFSCLRLLFPPSLPEPRPGKTYYTAFRFGRPEDLKEAARTGSLCSRLYLAVKVGC
jgi:8-oxo-dGTP diphosphatase